MKMRLQFDGQDEFVLHEGPGCGQEAAILREVPGEKADVEGNFLTGPPGERNGKR